MMTYCEFRNQLRRARLTVREFAKLMRMHENSITNYSQKGTVPSHLAVVVLLVGELAANKLDFRTVFAQLEIDAKKPRGGPIKFGIRAPEPARTAQPVGPPIASERFTHE